MSVKCKCKSEKMQKSWITIVRGTCILLRRKFFSGWLFYCFLTESSCNQNEPGSSSADNSDKGAYARVIPRFTDASEESLGNFSHGFIFMY